MFTRADFPRMAGQFAAINGRFLLSMNALPDVRATFCDFHLVPVSTVYIIAKGSGQTPRDELRISNFPVVSEGARQP